MRFLVGFDIENRIVKGRSFTIENHKEIDSYKKNYIKICNTSQILSHGIFQQIVLFCIPFLSSL